MRFVKNSNDVFINVDLITTAWVSKLDSSGYEINFMVANSNDIFAYTGKIFLHRDEAESFILNEFRKWHNEKT